MKPIKTIGKLKSGAETAIVAPGDSLTQGRMVRKGCIDFLEKMLRETFPERRLHLINYGGLLFLFVISIFITSCLSWFLEKPSIIVREIIISPRSLVEMNLILGIEVQNLNRFDLTLTSFEYTFYLNNEEAGSGRIEKEILIPASSTTGVQVPVAATFKNLGGSLKTIITGDDLPYKIEGTAGIKTAFGSLSFPLSKEGLINLKDRLIKHRITN
ncbi:MAG TPA: LEA type 2 family protein [Syntrophales bacterium]|nr:LEA type 2 family protein [Syntrophales bacterium]